MDHRTKPEAHRHEAEERRGGDLYCRTCDQLIRCVHVLPRRYIYDEPGRRGAANLRPIAAEPWASGSERHR